VSYKMPGVMQVLDDLDGDHQFKLLIPLIMKIRIEVEVLARGTGAETAGLKLGCADLKAGVQQPLRECTFSRAEIQCFCTLRQPDCLDHRHTVFVEVWG